MQIAVLGIDLGKNSCSVVGLDLAGRVVLRRRLHRDGVIKLAAGMSGCVMAMEACCGAHHLGRLLRDHGHQVRLMSPEYVRPYVKAQKNDDRDAEAIAEAATRPTMRFVELKSEAQLDMQSLHRVRDRLVGEPAMRPRRHHHSLLSPGLSIERLEIGGTENRSIKDRLGPEMMATRIRPARTSVPAATEAVCTIRVRRASAPGSGLGSRAGRILDESGSSASPDASGSMKPSAKRLCIGI